MSRADRLQTYIDSMGDGRTPMQWFPMDTAPRDGTPVLAARNNDLFWEYTVVWWHDTGTTGGFYPWQANNTAYPEERLDYWTPIKEPYMIEHDIDVGC